MVWQLRVVAALTGVIVGGLFLSGAWAVWLERPRSRAEAADRRRAVLRPGVRIYTSEVIRTSRILAFTFCAMCVGVALFALVAGLALALR